MEEYGEEDEEDLNADDDEDGEEEGRRGNGMWGKRMGQECGRRRRWGMRRIRSRE